MEAVTAPQQHLQVVDMFTAPTPSVQQQQPDSLLSAVPPVSTTDATTAGQDDDDGDEWNAFAAADRNADNSGNNNEWNAFETADTGSAELQPSVTPAVVPNTVVEDTGEWGSFEEPKAMELSLIHI